MRVIVSIVEGVITILPVNYRDFLDNEFVFFRLPHREREALMHRFEMLSEVDEEDAVEVLKEMQVEYSECSSFLQGDICIAELAIIRRVV